MDMKSQLESILLIVDSSVSSDTLAEVLDSQPDEVEGVLTQMAEELTARGSGIDLRRTQEGWRFYTRAENSAVVEKFLLDGSHSRLSKAALETLAIVAYRQPVTRAQIAAIRGVNVDGVVRTLVLRGLIRELDQEPITGAHRYEVTELFLELMGMDSLAELPELAPLLPEIDSIDVDF